MNKDALQIAFMQNASHMERLISDQYKEIYAWAAFQIRKELDIEKDAPLPQNWKFNIPYYLHGFIKVKYFEKLDNVKGLQSVLENFYTIYRGYDNWSITLRKHIEMQDDIIKADGESIQFYLNLMLDMNTNNNHQLISSTKRA